MIESDGCHEALFPRFLHLFEELDEEAEREDGRQAVAEEIAGAHFLAVAAIEPQAGEEENKIGDGFVKLSRMARYDVAVVGEDEAPGYVSRRPTISEFMRLPSRIKHAVMGVAMAMLSSTRIRFTFIRRT